MACIKFAFISSCSIKKKGKQTDSFEHYILEKDLISEQ